jgi:hypothetical protein
VVVSGVHFWHPAAGSVPLVFRRSRFVSAAEPSVSSLQRQRFRSPGGGQKSVNFAVARTANSSVSIVTAGAGCEGRESAIITVPCKRGPIRCRFSGSSS